MSVNPTRPSACAVEAAGAVRVAFEDIAGLRKSLAASSGRAVAPSLVKHADVQTVVALAAVFHAIDVHGWRDRSFDDWAVVAAPRFLGRVTVTGAADRFRRIGVPGMSPLIIPTLSLHAVSASISLALESHGFNYGVSGGPGNVVEGLLAGLTDREGSDTAGTWLVVSGFNPEPIPDDSGRATTRPSTAYAIAMALTSAAVARRMLRVVPAAPARGDEGTSDLAALADFVDDASPLPRRWYAPMPGGGAIEFDDDPARAAGAVDQGAARAG